VQLPRRIHAEAVQWSWFGHTINHSIWPVVRPSYTAVRFVDGRKASSINDRRRTKASSLWKTHSNHITRRIIWLQKAFQLPICNEIGRNHDLSESCLVLATCSAVHCA
jgi:hypothetical protein